MIKYTVTVLVTKQQSNKQKNAYLLLLKCIKYILSVKVSIFHHDILKFIDILRFLSVDNETCWYREWPISTWSPIYDNIYIMGPEYYWVFMQGIPQSQVHSIQTASHVEFWWRLWCWPLQNFERLIELKTNWDALTLLWHPCNEWYGTFTAHVLHIKQTIRHQIYLSTKFGSVSPKHTVVDTSSHCITTTATLIYSN